MTTNPERHTPGVAEAIRFLSSIVDERQFATALADTLMVPKRYADDVFGEDSPEPINRADAIEAFRSPELINRSVPAARYLIDNVNAMLKSRKAGRDADPDKTRGRIMYLNIVGQERRILENILAGDKGRRGILDTKPNPRRRAQERLFSLNMQGPVPAGMWRKLLEEEEQKVIEARREAKRKAKEAKAQGKAPAYR